MLLFNRTKNFFRAWSIFLFFIVYFQITELKAFPAHGQYFCFLIVYFQKIDTN